MKGRDEMRGRMGLVAEFVLISVSATFVVHAVGASAAAPRAQAQAPMPTAEQVEAAVAHADAQALAVNGRR